MVIINGWSHFIFTWTGMLHWNIDRPKVSQLAQSLTGIWTQIFWAILISLSIIIINNAPNFTTLSYSQFIFHTSLYRKMNFYFYYFDMLPCNHQSSNCMHFISPQQEQHTLQRCIWILFLSSFSWLVASSVNMIMMGIMLHSLIMVMLFQCLITQQQSVHQNVLAL